MPLIEELQARTQQDARPSRFGLDLIERLGLFRLLIGFRGAASPLERRRQAYARARIVGIQFHGFGEAENGAVEVIQLYKHGP